MMFETLGFDNPAVAAIFATFFLAGAVKGIIGLGLPTISLAILTVVIDMPTAMALLLVPSFVTNLWQASAGGQAFAILRRLWLFFLFASATVWVGAVALRRVHLELLPALLGLLLVIYGATSLAGLRLKVSPRREVSIGATLGLVNGLLTGLTGSFVVPGVMFLQAIGLSRDQLIQAMGILFTLSTLALGLALGTNGMLTTDQGLVSLTALVPALLGMFAGRRLRRMLSEKVFRRALFAALLVLGLYIIGSVLRGYT